MLGVLVFLFIAFPSQVLSGGGFTLPSQPSAAPSRVRSSINSIFTIAGNGNASSTGTGGAATAMTLNRPVGIWEDSLGGFYVVEAGGKCVRMFSYPNGIVSDIAGVCVLESNDDSSVAGDNGPATSALLYEPISVVVDTVGVIYIADLSCHIWKVSNLIITNFAGDGMSSYNDATGSATSANIVPAGLWVDSIGQLYATDASYSKVRKISTVTSIITLFAGASYSGLFSGDGGPVTSSKLSKPRGVFADSNGMVYISDSDNNRVRQVSVAGIINTIMGSKSTTYNGENIPATSSSLNNPYGVVVDVSNGDIYVASNDNYRIQVMTETTSLVSTFAGSGTKTYTGDGGAATAAGIVPFYLYLDTNSRLYISEHDNNRVRVTLNTSPTMAPSAMPSEIPTTEPSLSPSVVPTVSFAPSHVRSNMNTISTIAGTGVASSTGTGGLATATTLNDPSGIWEDSLGVIYVVESSGNCVRKFSYPNGIVADVAGVCGLSTDDVLDIGDNGPATSAALNGPVGVVVDTVGTIYISDLNHLRIRKLYDLIITTFVGNGMLSDSVATGPATSANIFPLDLWIDSLSQLYVTDFYYHKVRKISTISSIITLFAGVSGIDFGSFSGDGGPATSATLNNPRGVFADSGGIVYIADGNNNRVRQVSVSGIISTVIGNDFYYNYYNGQDIPLTSATLSFPEGVVVDSSNGDIYVASYDSNIVQVKTRTTSLVTTFVGSGSSKSTGDGGEATAAGITPVYLYLDTNSRLFISDQDNNRVRVVLNTSPTVTPSASPTINPTLSPSELPTTGPSLTPSVGPSIVPTGIPSGTPAPSTVRSSINSIYTAAGTGIASSTGTGGVATAMTLNSPTGIWEDSLGVFYVVEQEGQCIRSFSYPNGIVANVAGVCGSSGSYGGDNGPATSALLKYPVGIAADTVGVIYVADYNNYRIRKVSNLIITTVAGSGSSSNNGNNGAASSATIAPYGLWIDSLKQLYVACVDYCVVSKISTSSTSTIESFAGTEVNLFSGDNGPATSADLSNVYGVYADSSGIVYITDSGNLRVRQVSVAGIIKTVIGTGSVTYNGENIPATSTNLNNPHGVVVDFSNGDIYVASTSNDRVQVMTSTTSLVTTFAGIGSKTYSGDGGEASAAAISVFYLYLDTNSRLYVSDYRNNRIRVILYSSPTNYPTIEPTIYPSVRPSVRPTRSPTEAPSIAPTINPTVNPSLTPSVFPSVLPTTVPSVEPTANPSIIPSLVPSMNPSVRPSLSPSIEPSIEPTLLPTCSPSLMTTANQFNSSISVIGSDVKFKIVIPFLPAFTASNSIAFSNITLSSGSIGVAYIVPGSSIVGSKEILLSTYAGYSNFIGTDSVMRSVSALGDINGDGYSDLIVGDPLNARCYVLLGKSEGFVDMNQGFTIYGESGNDLTGWSVSGAGDVNNDTIADIIIGAPFARNTGAVYVIYGNRSLSDVYLSSLVTSQGFALYGAERSDYLGISVSNAGDVNNDGYDDIVVGAVVVTSLNAGAAYILYGDRNLRTLSSLVQLTPNQGYKLSGGSFYLYAGWSVSATGDVNKDGFDDVLIGSSPSRSNVATVAYLIFGANITEESPRNVLLSTLTSTQGVRIVGAGTVVSYVGDNNNEGNSNILVGAFSSSSFDTQTKSIIVYTNIVDYVSTLKPSNSPTVIPSNSPTAIPSLKPTRVPTTCPSKKPSLTPSLAPIGPTIMPFIRNITEYPTVDPTAEPTVITLNPTLEPSESPTLSPTNSPSVNPSMSPTIVPTDLPITLLPTPLIQSSLSPTESSVISHHPVGVPSMLPTTRAPVSDLNDLVVGSSTHYNQSSVFGNYRYFVNGTGDVLIDPAVGRSIYAIVPGNNLTLTITRFNVSSDVIDLSKFSDIQQYSDLIITHGSVIITLYTTQVIHIMNQESAAISASNFIFRQPTKLKKQNVALEDLKIYLPVGIVIVIVCYYAYRAFEAILIKAKEPRLTSEKCLGMIETDALTGEYIFIDDESEVESHASWLEETEKNAADLSNFFNNQHEVVQDYDYSSYNNQHWNYGTYWPYNHQTYYYDQYQGNAFYDNVEYNADYGGNNASNIANNYYFDNFYDEDFHYYNNLENGDTQYYFESNDGNNDAGVDYWSNYPNEDSHYYNQTLQQQDSIYP